MLVFYDSQHPRVSTDEGAKILGCHHQALDALDCDHSDGAYGQMKPAEFTNQLPWAALSQDALPAVLIDADPGPPLKYDDHTIG